MVDQARVEQLERRLRFTMIGLALALFLAAVSLFWSPGTAGGSRSHSDDELVLSGGARLEMAGEDLRITLPGSSSAIVLQTPAGEEIARLGAPVPRRLGE